MSDKKHKLDIFQVLTKLSVKDRKYFKALTEEEQKALAPLVVMRWLSGTRDARQIFFLNELVNPFVFSMSNHKELLVDLMMTSTSGRSQKYFWNKAKTRKSSGASKTVEVIRDYFGYSTTQAADALPLLSTEDVLQFAEELGRQPDDIKNIKKELKDRERTSVSV